MEDTTDEQVDYTFRTGAMATLWGMQAVFPIMKERGWGKIINFASTSGMLGTTGNTSYNMTKEAVRALSRTAANEWGQHGINVNVISRESLRPIIGDRADQLSDAELVDSIDYSVFPNFHPWAAYQRLVYRFRPNGDDHESCIMDVYILSPFHGVRPAAAPVQLLGPEESWIDARRARLDRSHPTRIRSTSRRCRSGCARHRVRACRSACTRRARCDTSTTCSTVGSGSMSRRGRVSDRGSRSRRVSAPAPRKSARPQDRELRAREQLIQAARKVFERDGFHGARIVDVANAAGVGIGTFYRNFESKSALFRAVIGQVFDEIYTGGSTHSPIVRSRSCHRAGQPPLPRAIPS